MGGGSPKSFGWKCAQRRPLRALAHALALFYPNYVFLGDDDTYVNFPLLQQFRSHALGHGMDTELISYGAFHSYWGDYFFGGNGYIFGREVVRRLVGHRIITTDSSITEEKAAVALLYNVLLNYEKIENITGDRSRVSGNDTDESSIDGHSLARVYPRVIDLCSELYAGEQTCMHSDHSVSYCLTYGIGAIAKCGSINCLRYETVLSYGVSYSEIPNFLSINPVMCAPGIHSNNNPCDPRLHLTCHMTRPQSLDIAFPVRNRRGRGWY